MCPYCIIYAHRLCLLDLCGLQNLVLPGSSKEFWSSADQRPSPSSTSCCKKHFPPEQISFIFLLQLSPSMWTGKSNSVDGLPCITRVESDCAIHSAQRRSVKILERPPEASRGIRIKLSRIFVPESDFLYFMPAAPFPDAAESYRPCNPGKARQ